MTEKELFKAAAQLDMPDFEEVRRACLGQKPAKRSFRYKKYIAAAACLALILIAVPVAGNFRQNAVSGNAASTAAYSADETASGGADGAAAQESGTAASESGAAASDDAETQNAPSSGAQSRERVDTGAAAGGSAAKDAGAVSGSKADDGKTDAAGDAGTAAVAPSSVSPNSLSGGAAEYSFTQLDSAPAQSYFALNQSDFTAMTADEMEKYFGVPLLPVSAPDGYTETTGDGTFGVFRREGGDVYYDAATRSFEKDGSEYDFTTSEHTLFVLPELSATVINGYSVELYKWSFPTETGKSISCFGARFASGDATYSITGTNVTEEEFVGVLLAQIGG
jgi:cytoskeletal protein RodZ